MKYKDEDRPTGLIKHIKWLEEIDLKTLMVGNIMQFAVGITNFRCMP